jgi:hypothetical protein
MRSIFHEILARYLESEQHAFDASPRELWPEAQPETRWQAAARGPGRAAKRRGKQAAYGELEPQN